MSGEILGAGSCPTARSLPTLAGLAEEAADEPHSRARELIGSLTQEKDQSQNKNIMCKTAIPALRSVCPD